MTNDCLDEEARLKGDEILNCKRKVSLAYRGVSVEVSVNSWAQELDLRIGAWLKSAAIDSDLIKELSFEVGLFKKGDKHKIDKSLLEDFVKVRATMEEMLSKGANSGTIVVDMLNKNSQVVLGSYRLGDCVGIVGLCGDCVPRRRCS